MDEMVPPDPINCGPGEQARYMPEMSAWKNPATWTTGVHVAGCESLPASVLASLLASQRLRQRCCRRAIPWANSLGSSRPGRSGRFRKFV
jgi:hypothetical protein